MKRLQLSSALLGLSLASACQSPVGQQEWSPTFGLRTAVYDDYDFDINSLILAESGGINYTMTELTLGATLVEPGAARPIKQHFLGLSIGTGDLTRDGISSSLVETSLGGTWYFDDEGLVVPFVSLFGTLSNTSKIPDLGNQGGLRLGTGIEVPIHGGLFATLGVDYLMPLYDAKTGSGVVEANLDGFAIRLGFLYSL